MHIQSYYKHQSISTSNEWKWSRCRTLKHFTDDWQMTRRICVLCVCRCISVVAMQKHAGTFDTSVQMVVAEPGLMCRLKDHFITTPLFWLIAFLLAGFCGRICFCLEHALMKGMSVCLTSFSVSTKAPFSGIHLTWVYSKFEEKGILFVASLFCCKSLLWIISPVTYICLLNEKKIKTPLISC